MSFSEHEKLVELIGEFDTAMLVTRSEAGELRSRPMAIADCTNAARLWFVTSSKSGKLEELTEHPSVNVSLQGSQRFLSISGMARTNKNRGRIRELWQAGNEIWLDGPDDPATVLLEIVPTTAEYWDASSGAGLKMLFESAVALVTGEKPVFDPQVHAKVEFPEKQIGTD